MTSAHLGHKPDHQLFALGSSQFGLVSLDQLQARLSASAISRRVSAGRLVRLNPRAFAFSGVPETFEQRALAAAFWAGPRGACSGRTAAALHRLDGFRPGVIEVTSPTRTKPVPGLTAHSGILHPIDLTHVRGIPVTSVARTLLDLGAHASRDDVELALEDALRRDLVKLPRLRWFVATFGRRGRRGTAILRSLLEARPKGYIPTGSALEVRTARVIKRSRYPEPERQYPIKDGGHFVIRADFVYPERKLVIEADGYKYHGGRQAWVSDSRKRNRVTGLGWSIIVATDESLQGRDPQLLADMAPFFA